MAVALPPQGPRGSLIMGNMAEFNRDYLEFFSRCSREYGDVVRLRFLHVPAYFLNHPDHIEEALITKNRYFIKPDSFRTPFMRKIFGNGLLTSEGDFWLRQRRLAQPAFHRNRIAEYGKIMVAFTERMIDRWQAGETRDAHRDMMGVTLEIAAKTLFDADMEEEVESIGLALEELMKPFTYEGSVWWIIDSIFPTPANLRFRKAVRRFDEIIYRVIGERRANREDKGDLLSMLLAAQDEDGSRMTDRQLRDEVMTLLLAGHETTALALSWTWYLLSEHPEVDARLAQELREVLGERSPEMTDLPRLRYTEAVIKEAMRLYPPAYVVGREAAEDCEIAGYHVARKTQVFFSQWVVHRDPRYFEAPEKFNPDRWSDDLEKRLPKYAYFPFGGGPRVCIGQSFAMIEAVLLLATIAQRFRLKMIPGHPIGYTTSMTLRPTHGIKVVVEER